MALTVTDLRTTPSEADATGSWTAVTGTGLAVFTSDPDPVEATGCLGIVVSTATAQLYYTVGSTNLQNNLVYAWAAPFGQMDTLTNGGVTLILGDGTNRIGYHLAGSDRATFRHPDGPVTWQSLLVDTANLPASLTAYAGSAGSLNLAAITQIGVGFKTLAKSKGGVANCFVDAIRYGTGGLQLTAGTSGVPGTWDDIAADDRTTTNLKGYGIFRRLVAGVYGCQGPLVFGSTGTTASYFVENNSALIFEDRSIRGGRYSITIQGNATGSTTFRWGTKTGTGDTMSGVAGVTVSAPADTSAPFTASNSALQFVLIYGSTITNFRGALTFSSDATNGPNHEFGGNTVSGCGQMNPGRIVVRNCIFSGFVGASDGSEAAILWGANTDLKRCSFTCAASTTNDIKGHGIKIGNTGSITFDALKFSGYGPTVFGFNTTTDVDGSAETVTKTAHGYTTGNAIRYNKQGGSVNMGLTDSTTYYVRAVSANLLAFYTSVANANSDTSRINLTATGTETHYISSMDAAVYNNSGGAVTINVVNGGDTPTIRNGSGSSTTVVNSVTLTVTVKNESGNAVQGARVRIQTDPGAVYIIDGTTNASGIFTTSYAYTAPEAVLVRVRLKGYIPFDTTGTITTAGLDVGVRFIKDSIVD